MKPKHATYKEEKVHHERAFNTQYKRRRGKRR